MTIINIDNPYTGEHVHTKTDAYQTKGKFTHWTYVDGGVTTHYEVPTNFVMIIEI